MNPVCVMGRFSLSMWRISHQNVKTFRAVSVINTFSLFSLQLQFCCNFKFILHLHRSLLLPSLFVQRTTVIMFNSQSSWFSYYKPNCMYSQANFLIHDGYNFFRQHNILSCYKQLTKIIWIYEMRYRYYMPYLFIILRNCLQLKKQRDYCINLNTEYPFAALGEVVWCCRAVFPHSIFFLMKDNIYIQVSR